MPVTCEECKRHHQTLLDGDCDKQKYIAESAGETIFIRKHPLYEVGDHYSVNFKFPNVIQWRVGLLCQVFARSASSTDTA